MNDDEKITYIYYAPFYCQIYMKMYLQEHNTIQQNEEFFVIKFLSWIYH